VITGEMESENSSADERVGGWVDEIQLDASGLASYPPSLIPVGMITERDIVQFRVLGLNFGETQAQTVMSTPLLPIGPLDSLWAAHEQMQQHHIRRLVVVGEVGQLVGIVTQTSLLRSLDPLETSASIAALQKLVEERTKEFWQAYKGLQCEIRQHRQTAAALKESQARLIGILDIAEDAIISIDENQRIQLFNQGAEKIFGYAATEVLFHPIDLLLPHRLKATHFQYGDHSDCTDAALLGERREIVGRRKNGTEFPAEVSISQLKLGPETILIAILRDITERKRAEVALRNQIARERLLGAIASRIRQSLDLDTILKTTVEEVQQFLGCDRVIIYRFSSDYSGVVVVESVSPKWLPIIGNLIQDDCFTQDYLQLYQNGRIKATEDIHTAEMHPCYVDLLVPFQIRANLVVPILLSSPEFLLLSPEHESGMGNQFLEMKKPTPTGHSQVWGLLSAHQCSGPRQWQDWEIELLQQLAIQVAIAIQQAELYQQLLTANQQLQQLASLDGLTQVANRRRFDEYFHQEWRRLARDQEPLSLILCDVDCFKAYNDTYGHLEGDTSLQQVATAIRAALKRPADLVARYGGEEFAVVLPNTPAEGATRVALEIQSTIRALKIEHSKSCVSKYLTISLGVASTVPSHQSCEAMLIAVADKALYQAKAQGRDRFVLQEFDCQS
jgi:diguanylate cyclase (GGDEF)-like protein/PAS domain S-box-containing protein